MKTIGVLTSGGDAPGMNAAIRAVVRTAIENNMHVLGINNGYDGLMKGDVVEMNLRSVSNIINRGGTILRSARSEGFKTEAGQKKAAEMCRALGIEGLVVIGGDGSFRGAQALAKQGVVCVGIPGTIDNDIACTDSTIGFDTAMNTVMEMVDKIRDTAESHSRCSVVEVMGRDAGYIALYSGIAVGATVILVPEFEYDMQKDVIDVMKRTLATGKHHFVIIVAEGCGLATKMAQEIEAATGVETRATILGHVQRGGSPTVNDRVLASRMGNYAARVLRYDNKSCVVAIKDNKIVDYPIDEALAMKKELDIDTYRMAHEISI
ncbi:MAG: 6-phosphofructokinase [Oscillospiraceae bacterium]|nr:6-phosphofructokinase [Candidatus Limimonas coprohippi]MCQ2487966.1 6-phosphofructokinase [Clostridia bacterium]